MSPVPPNACALVANPLRRPYPMAYVPRDAPAGTGARGARGSFDSGYSSSESKENERDNIQAGENHEIEGGGSPGAGIVALDCRGGTAAIPQGEHPPEIGGQGWMDRSVGSGLLQLSSRRTIPEADAELKPISVFLERHERRFDSPQPVSPQLTRRELIRYITAIEDVAGANSKISPQRYTVRTDRR